MNKHTRTPNKQRWLATVCLLISILNMLPAQVQASGQRKLFNWVEYLWRHPDYRKHQEPQDIATQGCLWGTWVTFPNKIAAIAAKVRNWEDPTALFKSLDFVAMYKHPGHYYNHCLQYLADPKHSEQHKQIVIYAMEQYGHLLAFECYKLYQQQQLSEALFGLALGGFELLRIHPLVVNYLGPGPCKWLSYNQEENTKFLRQVQAEVGAQTPLGLQVEAIRSGQLAKQWERKGPSPLLHYSDPLPIAATIRQATQEYLKYEKDGEWVGEWKELLSEAELTALRGQQHFLMLLEHVNEYIFPSDETYNDDFFSLLKDPHTTNDEKRLFLLAMYRLEGFGDKNTLQTCSPGVASLLARTTYYYRAGHLALPLLEALLYSPIVPSRGLVPGIDGRMERGYPRYPFFVTFYKSYHIQENLDHFIDLPTVPSDWKTMAKQLKTGTLLTKQEMSYMNGYRDFIHTHFALYDTIPPQK